MLLIDDIGDVRREDQERVLIELICQRYERRSLLITSNQTYTAWEEVVSSNSMTGAAMERLMQHCRIVEISDESHRRQDAAQRTKRKQALGNRLKTLTM